jgi:hypothetical protein
MKAQYIRAMDAIHQACLFIAGSCLVIITVIVPYGVFTRKVLNSAASWPEPMAVLLMIVLVVSLGGRLHIANISHRRRRDPGLLPEQVKPVLGWFLDLHAGDQSLHALVGHQAGRDHLVSKHR